MARTKKVDPRPGTRFDGARRAAIFLVFSALMGGLSIVGLNQMIQGYEARIMDATKPEDTVMVIVAARDLYQGITIAEEDLYLVHIPPRYLPENVFLTPDHVVGRVPRERILANELVRGDRLADPESGAGLNAVIPRGMRAISIDLADARALASFLQPGSYVDLLVTIKPDRDDERQVTKTILQSVFVLGVDSRAGDETEAEARDARGKHKPSVTLLVNAGDAEVVANAQSLGEITLALRGNDDIAFADTEGVDVFSLRRQLEVPKVEKQREIVAPEPESWWIKIIKGVTVVEQETAADGTIIRD